MFITREELRKWAESLMPGDKVIVKSGDVLRIGTVKKVTPACWVVVEKCGSADDGENALKSAMNTLYYHNNPVTRYIADAVAEKLTREAAEEALRRKQNE